MDDGSAKTQRDGKLGSMKTTDLVFVDIETTGLLARDHEIIDIALVRVRQDWSSLGMPSFTIVDEWSTKVRPENIATADMTSLKINGYEASQWKGAMGLQEALNTFSEKTAGAIMVAHNIAFDLEFLNTHLHRLGIPNQMHYHRLDTVSMAFVKLYMLPEATRYSLSELCKHYGIEHEHAHSALSDARACFELFKRLVKTEVSTT